MKGVWRQGAGAKDAFLPGMPKRYYHVNELSKDRTEERFARHCTDIRWVHVRPMLAERYGFGDYYNWRAWTMIARH